ncbi:hypothetical protein [Arthrobacter sp. SW1]|uniref:hypothetical protein n=1 Tax=Arthrobacter sp. SW1 TaxID=1920889 RepID=UPI00209B1119|nr:hypothetical protein [Arthrobacter sp. SW1]
MSDSGMTGGPAQGLYPYRGLIGPQWASLGYPSEAVARHWENRSCGVLSLHIAYRLLLDHQAKPASLTEELLAAGAYSERNGWLHAGLAAHARKSGLKAELMVIDGPEEFVRLLRGPGLCIASVGRSFDEPGTRGHLVLASGITEGEHVTVHDPNGSDPSSGYRHIPLDAFWEHFSKRVIYLSA